MATTVSARATARRKRLHVLPRAPVPVSVSAPPPIGEATSTPVAPPPMRPQRSFKTSAEQRLWVDRRDAAALHFAAHYVDRLRGFIEAIENAADGSIDGMAVDHAEAREALGQIEYSYALGLGMVRGYRARVWPSIADRSTCAHRRLCAHFWIECLDRSERYTCAPMLLATVDLSDVLGQPYSEVARAVALEVLRTRLDAEVSAKGFGPVPWSVRIR